MFTNLVSPIIELIDALVVPLLAIVMSAGTLFCVVLGVKYAKADEPQAREKAKGALKNAIVGFVMIFVLIMALNLGSGIMVKWVEDNADVSISISTTDGSTTDDSKSAD